MSLRLPLDGTSRAVLTLTPRARIRFRQSDLARHFRFESDLVVIDPRVPPEGTVSYRVLSNNQSLVFEFTRRSRTLRKLQITEGFAT
ncbi:hypothetical protein ACFROC_20670 [Nocardia tengchongensis]|uniref:hypothetical protein n=1 Tax=Nocardia tengchongensis TaxID=2055889 RepID=UPI00369C757D